MMKAFVVMNSAIALTTALGCSRQDEEGVAERAGKQMDETIEEVEAYTSEKMEEMGKVIEHAGEEMQE